MIKKALKHVVVVFLVLVVLALSWLTFDRGTYRVIRAAGRATPAWAGSEWRELRAGNFTLYYQKEDSVFAEQMVVELNRRLEQLTKDWGFQLPNQIPVRLHRSYASLNRSIGWNGESRTLGAYTLGRLELISPAVWYNEGTPEVWQKYVEEGPIVHELAHLVLDYASDGNFPVWFSEGFAQYWEYRYTGYVWSEPGFDMSDNVFDVGKLQSDFYECLPEIAAYRQSLGMVDLLYSVYGSEAVTSLIGELSRGVPFSQALEHTFGLAPTALDAKWRDTLDD